MPERKIAKVGYGRVSTKDQDLRRQINVMKNHGINLMPRDHGYSGADHSRPQYYELKQIVFRNDVTHIFVTELSRLMRDFWEFTDFWCKQIRRGLVHLHILDKKIILHKESPAHEWEIILVQAWGDMKFLESVRERTKQGVEAYRKANNKWGRPRDDSKDEQIIAYHKTTNYSQTKIAEKVGCSRSKVRTTLLRYGLI